jgi:hypothetical protein
MNPRPFEIRKVFLPFAFKRLHKITDFLSGVDSWFPSAPQFLNEHGVPDSLGPECSRGHAGFGKERFDFTFENI